METKDLALLIIDILQIPLSILALTLPLMQMAILLATVMAIIAVPLAINIYRSRKKLPLFPFIRWKYYKPYMSVILILDCIEVGVLLFVGIYYMLYILPMVLTLPINTMYLILLSAPFIACIPIGVAIGAIVYVRVQAWKRQYPSSVEARKIKDRIK